MVSYLARRLISIIPILLIVGVVVFFIMRAIPGDPAQALLGADATPAELSDMREKLGLNEPVMVQFVKWASSMIRGDFGVSIMYREPVLTVIGRRVEPTFLLLIMSMIQATFFGIALGIIAAINRNKLLDKLCMAISIVGVSLPAFWLGLMLILVFAVKLSLFPALGFVPMSEGGLWNTLSYLVLPSFALGIARAGSIARMTRSSMLDVLNNDYVRTARSKGLKESIVIRRHTLKNAMAPILTQLGITFAHLAGGAVVVETVFNIPGIGRLTFDSIGRRDYPTIQGNIICIALVYILINIVVDLCYKIFDPRIEFN
jgi:peptide/nickel transport system permease protein